MLVDTLLDHPGDRITDDLEETVCLIGIRLTRRDHDHRLAKIRIHVAGHVASDAGVDESLLDRRTGHGEQDRGERVPGARLLRVDPVDHLHGILQICPALLLLVLADRIGSFHALEPEGFLRSDLGIHRNDIEPGEILAVDKGEHVAHVRVSVEIDVAVGRRIIGAVELEELLVGKLGDHLRVAAGLHAVGRIRVHRLTEHAVRASVGIGKCSLHLAVHDSVDTELRLGALQLIVPALLEEDLFSLVDQRMQHGIHVDIDQVLKILVVAAGAGIAGPCGRGKRVDKCAEGSLVHLGERVLHGKFLGAAQHRMLQNMRHTRAVRRRGAESDAEHLVRIVVCKENDAGTALCVLQHKTVRADVRKVAVLAPLISLTSKIFKICHIGFIFLFYSFVSRILLLFIL